MTADRIPWASLPPKNCEDGSAWKNLMARYGHTGCPGVSFEDVCAHPWDCASKGACQIVHDETSEQRLKRLEHEAQMAGQEERGGLVK